MLIMTIWIYGGLGKFCKVGGGKHFLYQVCDNISLLFAKYVPYLMMFSGMRAKLDCLLVVQWSVHSLFVH